VVNFRNGGDSSALNRSSRGDRRTEVFRGGGSVDFSACLTVALATPCRGASSRIESPSTRASRRIRANNSTRNPRHCPPTLASRNQMKPTPSGRPRCHHRGGKSRRCVGHAAGVSNHELGNQRCVRRFGIDPRPVDRLTNGDLSHLGNRLANRGELTCAGDERVVES